MAVATGWSTLTNTPHPFFRYPRSRGNASPASPPLAQIALPQGVVRPGQSLRHSSAQVTGLGPIRPREDARFRGLFPPGLSPARARESPSPFACKTAVPEPVSRGPRVVRSGHPTGVAGAGQGVILPTRHAGPRPANWLGPKSSFPAGSSTSRVHKPLVAGLDGTGAGSDQLTSAAVDSVRPKTARLPPPRPMTVDAQLNHTLTNQWLTSQKLASRQSK